MAKEIKYGMVGGSIYAFIGEVHRKALAFDTRAELVAGCFSNVESENIDTAKAYGVSLDRTYKDYKEMAAAEAKRADKLDFVSICTPNFLHYEVAKEFLLAGINVVCEKPLCFAVEEAEELERLAKEKDLIFAVTYAYTGYVMPKVMKEMIAEGKIGTIAAIVAEYAQDWLIDELSPEKQGQTKNLSVWRTDPKFSGISNCVGDIGTHTNMAATTKHESSWNSNSQPCQRVGFMSRGSTLQKVKSNCANIKNGVRKETRLHTAGLAGAKNGMRAKQ